jgi:hypothetical protein
MSYSEKTGGKRYKEEKMRTVHILKLNSNFAMAVLKGLKTFEIRKNDRGFQTGDHIIFKVVDDSGREQSHELNNIDYVITYVLSGWGIQEGYVALGIRKGRKRRGKQ